MHKDLPVEEAREKGQPSLFFWVRARPQLLVPPPLDSPTSYWGKVGCVDHWDTLQEGCAVSVTGGAQACVVCVPRPSIPRGAYHRPP